MNKTLNSNHLHESEGIANEHDSSRTHCDSNGEKKPTSPSSSEGGGGGRQRGRRGGIGVSSDNRMSNKNRLRPKDYWELIKRRFSPLWALYPEIGRRDYESCLKYYNKIKASMPSMAYLCGVVANLSANVWGDYPPSLMKFMENKDWIGINGSAKSHIERNMPHWEKEVQNKLAHFNGVSNKEQTNSMQEEPQEPQQKKLCIPAGVKLPTLDKWNSETPEQQSEMAKLYKCSTHDLLDEIIRIYKLNNKNSQKQEVT